MKYLRNMVINMLIDTQATKRVNYNDNFSLNVDSASHDSVVGYYGNNHKSHNSQATTVVSGAVNQQTQNNVQPQMGDHERTGK